jgi:hypothetical protein
MPNRVTTKITADGQRKMFESIPFHKFTKADLSDPLRGPREKDDDKKLSEKLREAVAAMIAAVPSLHPQHAARWLLHTPQGRALLAQHTTKKEYCDAPN